MQSGKTDIKATMEVLGDPRQWSIPTGYRDSLALCVIDSIWSIGVHYSTVERVLDSYLKARELGGLEGHQSCQDGPRAFLDWFRQSCSPQNGETLAGLLGSRNRTSSRNGVLKADAVLTAMQLLDSSSIDTTSDLLAHASEIERQWIRHIPGQKSGISWRYVLMLAGKAGVKPDRMILSFMKRMDVPKGVTPEKYVDLIVRHVNIPAVNETVVDHRIWMVERKLRNN
jgi:hypothetical protein